jgi:KaiC/GvpD/RAD55 family RecA-like ATPase/predicted hydrocarbon binding protein
VPHYFLVGISLSSLRQLQELPLKSLILLVGPPGAGKSTFCQQALLQSVATDRPVIYVTTEYDPAEAVKNMRRIGLGEIERGLLNFIDVYTETVGVSVTDRPDTINADCNNLSSIDIAISKLENKINKKGVLLVFDSLTSPYLFNSAEILRFMRQTLSRFAAQENAVLACIDEGCGKSEDLVAMMSLSSGVVRMEIEADKRLFHVIKHPTIKPNTRIEVPLVKKEKPLWDPTAWDEKQIKRVAFEEGKLRDDIGDYVNLFWPTFSFWSCMSWDPQRFSEMNYEWNRQQGLSLKIELSLLPLYLKIPFKLFVPKSLSKVKDVKNFWSRFGRFFPSEKWGIGKIEYLDELSKTDEHHFRVYENFECSGFENVGSTMAYYLPPMFAGMSMAIESVQGREREINAIETKCIGLGDPFCEFKLLSGEIDKPKDSLHKDASVLEKIQDNMKHRLMGFLLEEKPLVSRTTLGSNIDMRCGFYLAATARALTGESFKMALRLGGARAGKSVGENLLDAGFAEDEAIKRILHFLKYCNVGTVTMKDSIRIKGNCESLILNIMTAKQEEPQCCFTTGFLNGFFSAVKNQHVKETKCVGMGDPYCEWEFR